MQIGLSAACLLIFSVLSTDSYPFRPVFMFTYSFLHFYLFTIPVFNLFGNPVSVFFRYFIDGHIRTPADLL